MEALSRRLRKHRRISGETLTTAADRLQVHWSTLQRWETGKNRPRGRAYGKLATYLEISIDEIEALIEAIA